MPMHIEHIAMSVTSYLLMSTRFTWRQFWHQAARFLGLISQETQTISRMFGLLGLVLIIHF